MPGETAIIGDKIIQSFKAWQSIRKQPIMEQIYRYLPSQKLPVMDFGTMRLVLGFGVGVGVGVGVGLVLVLHDFFTMKSSVI